MNAFQTCKDTSDIVPFYLPQQLYLKPIAKLNISLQLPNVTKAGKSISHWEIMEKLRELIKPEEFSLLKVSKSTLEFVRFEAELDTKKKVEHIVNKLDNKTIKLKNFSQLMRLRAASAKSDFPHRRIWDGFFQDAKDMNEMKPGERPDTIHLSNLPRKWFVPYHLLDEEDLLPSEKIFYKVFEKFGPIRYVDIPICDPYRNKMKNHISGIKNCTLEEKDFFEGYVQFKDYIGFTKCMDYLRDMKLIHKEEDETVGIFMKVDFDRSKHLSDASIRRREIVRDRLVKKQREIEEKEINELEEKKKREEQERRKQLDIKAEKEQRRKLREEKRKAVILEKLKIKGSDEINAKIAKEEKKLLKAQRKLESIRLIEELFKRIKEKKDSEKVNSYSFESTQAENELQQYKNTRELEVLNQKQKLHNALQGRLMLKTVLQGDDLHQFSSSSSDEESRNYPKRPIVEENLHQNGRPMPGNLHEQSLWYGYPFSNMAPLHNPAYQPPLRGHPAYMFAMRGRGGFFPRDNMNHYPGSSRGSYFPRRRRGNRMNFRGGYHNDRYPSDMENEYMKYFSKFLRNEQDVRTRRSRSRSRSRRSRSRSRRSRSHSRHRSDSRDRSYSRSASRGRRRSRSRSRSVSRSRRSYSRSRKRSRSRSLSGTRRSRRTKSRERSESRKNSGNKRSLTPEKDGKGSKRSRSADSSKFISPGRMRKRSKSWSLPKEGEKDRRDSWSRSPDKKD